MTATDQLRTVIRDLEAKAREMELDKKLATFADQADHVLREAAARAGEYAAENRERVEAGLDKAGAKVDEKTDGKYHRTFDKLKTGVLTGVDWVVEQRGAAPGAADAAAAPSGSAASDTPSGPAQTDTPSGPAASDTPSGSSGTPWVDVTDTPSAPTTPTTPEDPAGSR